MSRNAHMLSRAGNGCMTCYNQLPGQVDSMNSKKQSGIELRVLALTSVAEEGTGHRWRMTFDSIPDQEDCWRRTQANP